MKYSYVVENELRCGEWTRLQPTDKGSVLQILEQLLVNRNKLLGLVISEIELVLGHMDIETLLSSLHLLQLVGARSVHALHNTHKERSSIHRKVSRYRLVQNVHVEFISSDQCRHTRSTIALRNDHTVHIDQGDTRYLRDDLFHFTGSHILSLPSEGVAQTVHKIEESLGVSLQEITRAEILIALGQDIPNDFLVCICLAQVAIKLAAGIRVVNFSQEF